MHWLRQQKEAQPLNIPVIRVLLVRHRSKPEGMFTSQYQFARSSNLVSEADKWSESI